jgi:hypothetical protein
MCGALVAVATGAATVPRDAGNRFTAGFRVTV